VACIPKRNGTAREVLDTEVKYIENLEQVVEVNAKLNWILLSVHLYSSLI